MSSFSLNGKIGIMLKKFSLVLLTIFSLLFSVLNHAKSPLSTTTPIAPLSPQKIIVWQHTIDYPSKIIMSILIQALDITRDKYGDYEIVSSKPMEQRRAVTKLTKRYVGELDIAHLATTTNREKSAIAIRIPLIAGLSGYRVCLIKPNNQYKFSDINNKQDFINKKISIGQQQDWPDTKILTSNGLDVETSYKYSLLFRQLEKQRFDCFLRGINEIHDEIDQHTNDNFVIENDLLFYYPLPLFFYVNNGRQDLAKRLNEGLTTLQKNGTLTRLLAENYKDKVDNLHLHTRTLIKLNNPILPKESLLSIPNIPWLNDYISTPKDKNIKTNK